MHVVFKRPALLFIGLLALLVGILLLSGSLEKESANSETVLQLMLGRDEGNPEERIAIYRAKVPAGWKRIDPSPIESIADSRKSLCEYLIEDENGQVRIAVHNFPSENEKGRIPPAAQIMRWKRQFDELDLASSSTIPEAHGGFAGMFFIGTGLLKGEEVTVLGWAMQMAIEHYRRLTSYSSLEEVRISRQMRADYTIKALGPVDMMQKHSNRIKAFADSFELIEEIPIRP